MANCTSCNSYFRRSRFNQSDQCEDCLYTSEQWIDEEDDVDIQQLINPTGKTPARFVDD